MSVATPETEVASDDLLLDNLDADWEIVCDIPALIRANGAGFPYCQENPARWVAWRPNCCTAGPRYHLVCDLCKTTYQRWQAKNAVIVCTYCGAETGGFAAFTPLGKS